MLELGGAVVSVLDRLDREDVRLLPLRRVIASAVGLRWVRRQYSPLVAMHHMILRVRRKFFEITTKPNKKVPRMKVMATKRNMALPESPNEPHDQCLHHG